MKPDFTFKRIVSRLRLSPRETLCSRVVTQVEERVLAKICDRVSTRVSSRAVTYLLIDEQINDRVIDQIRGCINRTMYGE